MFDPKLPLVDLHRHLDGTVRIQTILSLGERFGVALPGDTVESLRPHVQVVEQEPSLVAFLKKLDWMVGVLGDEEACRRVAYENVEDAFIAGLDYAELRFSPYYMGMAFNIHPQAVTEAVIDGVAAATANLDIGINLIGIMSRTFGTDACNKELDGLLACRDKLVAVDLAGDELGAPGHLFEDHFRRVRDAGLNVTIHAGEAAGAESVRHAIEQLGAQRIGHGTNSVHDPALMAFLREKGIGIESCLTSNLQTSTVQRLQDHPLKTFLEQDILATINTDDPGVQGVDIKNEYEVAAPQAGLSIEQAQQAQRNGLAIAFLSDSEKKKLIEKKARASSLTK